MERRTCSILRCHPSAMKSRSCFITSFHSPLSRLFLPSLLSQKTREPIRSGFRWPLTGRSRRSPTTLRVAHVSLSFGAQ